MPEFVAWIQNWNIFGRFEFWDSRKTRQIQFLRSCEYSQHLFGNERCRIDQFINSSFTFMVYVWMIVPIPNNVTQSKL